MPEKKWIQYSDGEWKEVEGPGGWVKVDGKDWEWEWVSGSGKWYNENGKWVWVKN
jgi:hypothetical protein